jgi:hypothetical protein
MKRFLCPLVVLSMLFVTSTANAEWIRVGLIPQVWMEMQDTKNCHFRIVASDNVTYNYRFVKEIPLQIEAFGEDKSQLRPVTQLFSAPLASEDISYLAGLNAFASESIAGIRERLENKETRVHSMSITVGFGQFSSDLGVYVRLNGLFEGSSGLRRGSYRLDNSKFTLEKKCSNTSRIVTSRTSETNRLSRSRFAGREK